MTGREKVEAAFSEAGTREIPAVFCYEGIYIRDHWDELTSCPWWYRAAPEIERQIEWRREAFGKTGQDWFTLATCPPREARERTAIEARPDGVYQIDRRTDQESLMPAPQVGGWSPSGGLHSVQPGNPARTCEEIDARIPVPDSPDEGTDLADGRGDLAAAMLDAFGRDLYPIMHVASPLWRCYSVWGFEGMMTMVATRPDLVAHACGRHLASNVASVREAAALGASGIWIEECMTDMVNPDDFESLCVRFLIPLVEEIRAAGMKSIYYYCGNPTGKWDHLLSVGADVLSLEESKKGWEIDIEDVVERVAGRCALLGNLDAVGVLAQASDTALRAEIERQLAAGRRSGGRFIMSLGSPITPGTSVKRVRRYCDLVHEFRS